MAAVHDDIAGSAELTAQEKRGHRILIFRRIVAYVVLILVCVIALFPFVTLLINLTKDHATLTSTFNLIPGSNFLTNLKNALNDPNKPVIQAMGNSFIVAAITCVGSVYIAALTAYGLYAYDFRLKKAAFIAIMFVLMVPTQVSALGYVDLVKSVGMYNHLLPLIFPTLAAPGVFFFIKQYMESSLPMEIVSMMGTMGSEPLTKEQMLGFNAALNQIKK